MILKFRGSLKKKLKLCCLLILKFVIIFIDKKKTFLAKFFIYFMVNKQRDLNVFFIQKKYKYTSKLLNNKLVLNKITASLATRLATKLREREVLFYGCLQSILLSGSIYTNNKYILSFFSRIRLLLAKDGEGAKLFNYLSRSLYALKPSLHQRLNYKLSSQHIFFKVLSSLKNHFFLKKYIRKRKTFYYPAIIFDKKAFNFPLKWLISNIKSGQRSKKLDEKVLEFIFLIDNKNLNSRRLKLEFYKKVFEEKINLRKRGWKWRYIRRKLGISSRRRFRREKHYHKEWRIRRPKLKKKRKLIKLASLSSFKKSLLFDKSHKLVINNSKRHKYARSIKKTYY